MDSLDFKNLQEFSKEERKYIQEISTERKAQIDVAGFWDTVAVSNDINHCNEQYQDESILFADVVESNLALEGGTDSRRVDKAGIYCDCVDPLLNWACVHHILPSFLHRNLGLMKFKYLTMIQKHAIPLALFKVDMMCAAQTGSGKTVAYLLPIVLMLTTSLVVSSDEASSTFTEPSPEALSSDTSLSVTDLSLGFGVSVSQRQSRHVVEKDGVKVSVLILAPTRELVGQLWLEAQRLCCHSNVRVAQLYGGNDVRGQLRDLAKGCDILIATPGRLKFVIERGVISLSCVRHVVLDEIDRMVDMGFEPQINYCLVHPSMPDTAHRQTMTFSATIPDRIKTFTEAYMARDYVWIAAGRVGSCVDNVEQTILRATSSTARKLELVLQSLALVGGKTIIFVQKRATASWLCDALNNRNIRSEEIHGCRSQIQREESLQLFRSGYDQCRVLVATDVVSRGFDFPIVSHVIQFDMPASAEEFHIYIHRVGRTARAGHPGKATALFVPGFEVDEGNGKIADALVSLLNEKNQVVPDWLVQQQESALKLASVPKRQNCNESANVSERCTSVVSEITTASPSSGSLSKTTFGSVSNNYQSNFQQGGFRKLQRKGHSKEKYDRSTQHRARSGIFRCQNNENECNGGNANRWSCDVLYPMLQPPPGMPYMGGSGGCYSQQVPHHSYVPAPSMYSLPQNDQHFSCGYYAHGMYYYPGPLPQPHYFVPVAQHMNHQDLRYYSYPVSCSGSQVQMSHNHVAPLMQVNSTAVDDRSNNMESNSEVLPTGSTDVSLTAAS